MPKRSSKRPRDVNVLARAIVDESTGQAKAEPDTRNPHAVALGSLGGKKGGPARAAKLSERERKEIARNAAKARWGRRKASQEGSRESAQVSPRRATQR